MPLTAANHGPHPPLHVAKLRAQQRKDAFVVELLNSGYNVSKAYKALGISYQAAHKLMKDPVVIAAVEEATERHREAKAISTQSVLSEIARVAGSNLKELLDENGEVNIMSLTGRQSAAIAELVTTESADADGNVTTKRRVKLHDKLRALEMLGKYLKLFVDKIEVEGLDRLAEEMKKARERVENEK
jgi:phage terminase small subunit